MDPLAEYNRSQTVGDILGDLERTLRYRQPAGMGRSRDSKPDYDLSRRPVARELQARKARRFGK